MKEAITEFLQSLTGSPHLTVLLVSMLPLVELKGAIPVGEAIGLNLFQTAGMAYLGSTLVFIPVFFLLVPIFNLLKKWNFIRRLIEKIECVFKNKAARVSAKSGANGERQLRKMLVLGVFVFVALPLPLTGVWTGTAIAVFLGLKFKEVAIPITAGNLIAGSIVTLLTYLFMDIVEYIILGLFGVAIIMLIVFLIKVIISKPESI